MAYKTFPTLPRFRTLEKLRCFTLARTGSTFTMLSGPEYHAVGGQARRKVYCVRLGIDSRGTARGGFVWKDTEAEARAYFRSKVRAARGREAQS